MPLRMTWPFMLCTSMRALGNRRCIVSDSSSVGASTRIDRLRICRPMPSKKMASDWPPSTPSTKMRRGVRRTASATAGLETKTSEASTGRSTTAERPLARFSTCTLTGEVWVWTSRPLPGAGRLAEATQLLAHRLL